MHANRIEVDALKEQIEVWKNKYTRALADYQNLEKRKEEERSQIVKYATGEVLERFFPILDTFERAQAHLHDPGLGLALKEFAAAFEEQGVVRLDVLGSEFDPHTMDCTEVVEGNENIVMEVVETGY